MLLSKKHFSNFADSRVVLVNNSREGDVGVIFMFVNSRVAFWVKVFDSTDTNSPSGSANVGYMAIGAIHAQSGVDAWSVWVIGVR